MRLLVLGGTKFLGRAVVEAALEQGHEVSLFNRGETNPELFAGAEKLRGDRDGGLGALEGRRWDAVVDPSGYIPRVVRASAELLSGAAGHYGFVSSISVYGSYRTPGFDESAPVEQLDDPASEDVGAHYGGLKALCERAVADAFSDPVANIRAGLIVGPYDPTDRFTYWVTRLARGGQVLAPGRPDRQVQFVDVRDLAAWIVELADSRTAGTFNATGPVPPTSMGELLEVCRRVGGADAELVWVDEDFLVEREVGAWMELPLWIPESDEAFRAMQDADVSRAVETGLTFRPVEDTVRDTLAWARGANGTAGPLASGMDIGKAGMEPEREAELLSAWRARSSVA